MHGGGGGPGGGGGGGTVGVSHTSSAHVKASAHTPTYASHTSSRGGCGGALHDQGDATAYVYSDTAGYVACGSIGLGADVRRAADWDVTQSEFVMSLVASKSATSKSAATSGFLVANSQGEVLLALVLPTHTTPHLVANSDHAGGDSRCRRVELHALHTESRGAASSRAPQDAMLTEIPASDMRSAGDSPRGRSGMRKVRRSVGALALVEVVEALDAVAVADQTSLLPSTLMLVLTLQHKLVLYTGATPLCGLQLSSLCRLQLPSRGGGSAATGASKRIVGLSHAVGNRVNLRVDTGESWRIQVPSAASLLVRRALQQLRNNLPANLYWHVRRRMLAMEYGCSGVGGDGSEVEVGDWPGGEWTVFAAVVQSLVIDAECSVVFHASVEMETREVGEVGRGPTGTAAWQELLKTVYHKQALLSGELPGLVSDSREVFAGVGEAVGSAVDCSSSSWKQDACLALPSRFANSLANERGAYAAAGNCEALLRYSATKMEMLEHLERLLISLHCLYEDMKLNVLTHHMLPALARLLLHLGHGVGACSYCDYYIRYHPELAHLVHLNTLLQQPPRPGGVLWSREVVPDVFRWICDRFDGRVSPSGVCSSGSAVVDLSPTAVLARSPLAEFADPSQRILPATRKVCALVSRLTAHLDKELFVEHRADQHPSLLRTVSDFGQIESPDRQSAPASLLTSSQLMRNPSDEMEGMEASASASLTEPPDSGSRRSPDDSRRAAICQSVVEKMIDLGMELKDVDLLPLSVAIPIRECLWACRSDPPKHWPKAAYLLVSRADLATPVAPRPVDVSAPHSKHPDLVAEMNADKIAGLNAAPAGGAGGSGEASSAQAGNADGTKQDDDFARLRFGKDRRLVEVRRCLSAANPVCLRMPSSSEVTDHDIHGAHQSRLQLLARRTLSLAVGRGMFTLGLATPLPTEALAIPALQVAGRLPSNDALIKLDVALLPPDHAGWPEFHNGVAAALRLSLGQTAISRTWIVYNKPESANYAHAGVLMGLGLQGHLKALAKTDLYSYLCQDHEPTQIGIMLGMAVSKRGSMDEAVFKMLYVHIPSLHPANYPDLEVSSGVQTAAVMGIGLLYQGSKNRRMAEMLLSEIGRRATNDRLQDREGFSLAAGVALGLVCLGQGNSAPGLADLHIENTLRKYISGGRAHVAPTGGAASHAANAQVTDPTLCCRIKEGDKVNVDVTAAGATLALALMFLKTNNATVASRLAVPKTHFLLQYLRPDLVLLRVLARNLVMWDSIEPTVDFVEDLIPEIVKGAYHTNPYHTNANTDGKGERERDNARGAGAGDLETLRHVHANIVAASCMSIALRYAGSAEKKASNLLIHYIEHFKKQRAKCEGHRKVDKQLIETCLAIVALSASLVLAGTGDVELLRHLRQLRARVDGDVHYGHHMAISMAIGLLFLGGGRATLSTSNEAIAALVIALYPRFPISTSDCRYHLQALRHLYVLAVEYRCLETMDLHSNSLCSLPVEIQVKKGWGSDTSGVLLRMDTPCILPELCRVEWVRVCSERYWNVTWQVSHDSKLAKSLRRGCVLTVQRKTGHLSYSEDPFGLRNLHARPFPRRSYSSAVTSAACDDKTAGKSKAELIESFSGDPAVLAFAEHLAAEHCGEVAAGAEMLGCAAYTQVLYECLTYEKPEAIPMYAQLDNLTQPSLAHKAPWSALVDLRVILSYYGLLSPRPRHLQGALPVVKEALIKPSFLIQLRCIMDAVLHQHALPDHIRRYIADGSVAADCPPAAQRSLMNFLLFYGMPSIVRLRRARDRVREAAGAVGDGGAGGGAGGGCALPSRTQPTPTTSTQATGLAVDGAVAALIVGMHMRDVPPASVVKIAPYLVP